MHRYTRFAVPFASWQPLLLITLLLAGCGDQSSPDVVSAAPDPQGYVGAAACAECHAQEARRWSGSHHDLAMQPATTATVLGNFADATFDHHDVETTFFTRDGGFWTRTDGPDGEPAEYPVRYTFGVEPLQQYLVEMKPGRLQALSIAWDSRTAAKGGQRWFHLYGDEPVPHDDILHWTGMSQSWDSMCADCHSTAIDRQYDIEADAFDTHWAEINVACEACHGPGAEHVRRARAGAADAAEGLAVRFHERRDVGWLLDEQTGNSRRSEPRTTSIEIDTCAPCHSRRSRIAEHPAPGGTFLDAYLPALPAPPLYEVDGQMRDEVYVYGSFLQSKMYQSGVTCSDCHEPHSLELRAPGSGVCLQCHSSERFANPQHQLREAGAAEPACIDCHMPERTYMQVDARRDHSFRIPRPDLTVAWGVPNTCNACHADRDAAWAARVLEQRDRGPAGHARWKDRLAHAQSEPWDARNALLSLATDALAPGIIRATAITNLAPGVDPVATRIVTEQAHSSDPMLRWAVAQSLASAHPGVVADVGAVLLRDPVRAVRLEALIQLSRLDLELLPADIVPELNDVADEYIAAQLVTSERAPAHVNIGNLERNRHRYGDAEAAYRTALRLNPQFAPAWVNLADLYRLRDRDDDAEALLREGLQQMPAEGQAGLRQALGLTLVRLGRMPEATAELRAAATAPAANPRAILAYALVLDAQGHSRDAADVLERALDTSGPDPQLVAALINIYQRMGDVDAAQALAQRVRNR